MTFLVFATSDPVEARKRMADANSQMSNESLDWVQRLVADGAIRVGDNKMHPPGSVFAEPGITDRQLAEVHELGARVVAETRAATRA